MPTAPTGEKFKVENFDFLPFGDTAAIHWIQQLDEDAIRYDLRIGHIFDMAPQMILNESSSSINEPPKTLSKW